MNRATFRDDPEHPRCVGSVAYGPHPARPPRRYTVVSPLGKVMYACDSDCLRRHLDVLEVRAADGVSCSVDFLRRGGRP